jgi:hypothetical protein
MKKRRRGLKKRKALPVWIRNANNGAPRHYRILHLELRQRSVSR